MPATREHQSITWDPVSEIFSRDLAEDKHFGLVVLNQPLQASYYKPLWNNAQWVVAADGAASHIKKLNTSMRAEGSSTNPPLFHVDTVIGDLDSIELPDVRHWIVRGTEVIEDHDQGSTDFTKAIRYIKTFEVPSGAEHKTSQHQHMLDTKRLVQRKKLKSIVAIGGLGGRVDQGLSVLHHLFMFQEDDPSSRIYLVSPEGISFVLKGGMHMIKVKGKHSGVTLGQHIGILPLRGPSIITTRGLKWDVENWPTSMGGQISTSNQVSEFDVVTIATTSDVLFTIEINS